MTFSSERENLQPLKRELIVVAKGEIGLRATREGVASVTGANISAIEDFLSSEGIILKPLFGREERLQVEATAIAARTSAEVPDLSVYYQVEAADERLDDLAERLRQLDGVETAYVKPPAEPASFRLNEIAPLAEEPPIVTPEFTSRQNYLGAAPVGIDANYAWNLPGGRGTGVNIIDIEWGWRFTHEDLMQNQGGVVSGTNSSVLDYENHGTAVIGEFSGDQNSFGITGISPDARVSSVSLVTHSTAQAIRIAADRLQPGDIILLEVHRRGPNGIGVLPQFGYIAIEWWPDDFDAIRYAVNKGIIVVEAAGNGGQNLDDSVYDTNPGPPIGPFPASWRNPFNPANPSSGAVLVGAGNPPAGTHGRNTQPDWGEPYSDRARCFFSNYGARIDAQGWGWEVTSTGYGNLQGGSDRNQWYTDEFSGTSSASPIVVGALACVQGILRSQGGILLTPARARELLRLTGSAQQDGAGFTFIPNMTGRGYPQNYPARPVNQRIGNRPNLRQLIDRALESLVGTWNIFVDWGCDGNPVQASPFTFNSDGTWTYRFGGGRWIQVEGMAFWNFNNAPSLIYTANVTQNAMVGIQGYASPPPNPGKGCFYATRQGSSLKSQANISVTSISKDSDIAVRSQ